MAVIELMDGAMEDALLVAEFSHELLVAAKAGTRCAPLDFGCAPSFNSCGPFG